MSARPHYHLKYKCAYRVTYVEQKIVARAAAPLQSVRAVCISSAVRISHAARSWPRSWINMQSVQLSHSERPLVAVVEADAARRGSICRSLSALDIAVSDFDSAESYLAANDPTTSCLITDIALPGMSGLDLLRCLRARGVMPPMILLGEDCDVPAAVMAIREGASDFIELPLAELAIVQRVAQLLRGDIGFPAD